MPKTGQKSAGASDDSAQTKDARVLAFREQDASLLAAFDDLCHATRRTPTFHLQQALRHYLNTRAEKLRSLAQEEFGVG